MRYLLQKETITGFSEPMYNEIAVDAIPSLSMNVWNGKLKESDIMTSTLNGLKNIPFSSLKDVVPIGSIEFVETAMKNAYMACQVLPVNVPPDLSITNFWKRRIAFCSGAAAVDSIYEDWGVDELFIKSAKRLKTDITGIYKRGKRTDAYNDEPLLIVSEVLPLKTSQNAEWRVLVMNNEIVDIRCYAGNPWILPNKELVGEMVKKIPNSLRCCTIDVAVTDNGETAIIEIHNFVSCGAYGADVPLAMYRYAYIDELKRHGIRPEI